MSPKAEELPRNGPIVAGLTPARCRDTGRDNCDSDDDEENEGLDARKDGRGPAFQAEGPKWKEVVECNEI